MSREVSKFLSYVLRHAPKSVGIELDANGWVAVEELISKANAAGQDIDQATLFQVVETSDKKRFTLSNDRLRIRAAQGHSVRVDLGRDPVVPPEVLFHGTGEKSVAAILAEGLKPMSRQHVHLSADEGTAIKVGMRHGKPVVLSVDAAGFHAQGGRFWQADNGVWLSDPVPSGFISVAETVK